MTRPLARIAIALIVSFSGAVALAQGFETPARAAWIYDQTTDTVLFEKNADEPLPPASMSKLMTLYMAFEAIAEGDLAIDEELPVSAHAASFGGSTMFLQAGDRVTVEDLLRGVIVLSGNDASVVLAEGLGGAEPVFANLMTQRAREMGMANSTFANSSGWPHPDHRMSMRDLGILADRLIVDFPTFYPLFAEEEFLYDPDIPGNSQNRNPVLGLGIGADGLKTGHTEEAGYGLVGSAKQGDRRVIFVFTGLDSAAQRREEAERMVNWAFRQFSARALGEAGTQIAEARVWMGDAAQVGLVLPEDLSVLTPSFALSEISAEAVFDSPVQAPISAGQELGELVITRGELPEMRVPLVADRDVGEGGIGVRMLTAAQILAGKVLPGGVPGLGGGEAQEAPAEEAEAVEETEGA